MQDIGDNVGDGQSRTSAVTELRYIVALTNPNKPKQTPFHCWYLDNPAGWAKRDSFVRQWNGHPDRGIFYCIGGLSEQATATRERIVAVYEIVVDLDLKHIQENAEQVVAILKSLPLPPSEIRSSGHGIHAVWFLKEPATGDDMATAAAIMKKLSSLLASDSSVTRPESLLRLPGTKNTKDLDPAEHRDCEVIWSSATRANLPLDFDKLLESRPLLTPKEEPAAPRANGPAAWDDGTWQGPIDVEERLHNMHFGASDGSGINGTILSCTASCICQGELIEEIVPAKLAAVQGYAAAHPEECREWNSVITGDWSDEERTIASMCFRFINKNPDKAPTLPNHLLEGWSRQLNAGNSTPQIRFTKQRGWFVEGEPETPPRREEPPAKRPRFRLIPFRDLRPGPDPTCLVEDLIPLHGIVCVWGKPKCLKTFWVYDLCFHVARGLEYRGRRVRQGDVVYCAFEGAHGFGARTEALRHCHGLADDEDVPIHLVPGRADLVKEHVQLVTAIKDELVGRPYPAIVVLDTLNKSLVGSENKPEDMAGYVRAAEAIREAFNCVVIIVHHCGWDDSHPRGHSSLPGAVDAELSVVRSEKLVTVTVQLMKDGPEGVEIRSEVETVEVGFDKDGKVLTSLIVLPAEVPAGVASKGGRPEKNMPIFLKAMRAALLAHGEPFRPVGSAALERAVRQDEVRKLFHRWYADGEATEKDAASASQKAFKRCLEAAVSSGTVVKDVDPKGHAMLFFSAKVG